MTYYLFILCMVNQETKNCIRFPNESKHNVMVVEFGACLGH